MLKSKGIMSILTSPKFYHSVNAAGLGHTPVLTTQDYDIDIDSQMLETNVNTNYGTGTTMSVGDDGGGDNRQIILKPDLSLIPSERTLVSASIILGFVSRTTTNALNATVYRILRDWVESEVTYNIWKTANNWTAQGATSNGNDYQLSPTISNAVALSNGATQEFPLVLAEFNKFRDGTYTNYGVKIYPNGTGNEYVFGSSDNATPSLRPILRTTFYN
jgi:hypothetical protein